MMISVAIVEDEAAYAQQLREFLVRYSQESGQEVEISIFSD